MAAPRATQFIALRNLSRSNVHARRLHMLAPTANAASSIKTARQQHSQLDTPASTRSFSLSGVQQASHDTSTIDFFYFPSIDHTAAETETLLRVPILPDNYNPPRTGAHAPEVETVS